MIHKKQIQGPKFNSWVSICKLVAMMAVIVDHTTGILYEGYAIKLISYFSVTLFIFINGVTTFWSFERTEPCNLLKKIKNRTLNMLFAYLFAVFIGTIIRYGLIDFRLILESFVSFNLYGPFYFVALYLQLQLISPVIYKIVNWEKISYMNVTQMGGVILVSILSIKYSNVLDIDAAGGRLFGGSFLVVYLFGILFAKLRVDDYLQQQKTYILAIESITALVIAISIEQVIYRKGYLKYERWGLGNGINPPGIEIIGYALSLFLFLLTLIIVVSRVHNRLLSSTIDVLSLLGNHTLFVFLFHKMIIDVLKKYLDWKQGWIKTGVYLCIIWCVSLVAEKCYLCIRTYLSESYWPSADKKS